MNQVLVCFNASFFKRKNACYSMALVCLLIVVIESKGARVGGGFRGGGTRFGGGSSGTRFGGGSSGGGSIGGSFGGRAPAGGGGGSFGGKPPMGGGGASFGGGVNNGYKPMGGSVINNNGFKPAGGPIGGYGSNVNRFGSGGYNYRSGSGISWSSFGAGMLAYSAMSNLAHAGRYHNHGGYYYRNDDGVYRSRNQPKGEICINNEDFNGTVFGSFQCPMPELDPSAKYCCGSKLDGAQYCCRYFDDTSRKTGVILAVLAVFGIIVCSIVCIRQMMKRQKRLSKFVNRPMQHPRPMNNMQNINRNLYPAGRTNGFPPQPQPARGPVYNSTSNAHQRPPTEECMPFMAVNSQAPYPTSSNMPQPAFINVSNLKDSANQPPPTYTEAVTNLNQDVVK